MVTGRGRETEIEIIVGDRVAGMIGMLRRIEEEVLLLLLTDLEEVLPMIVEGREREINPRLQDDNVLNLLS